MRILLSALNCNSRQGSESLVAYQYAAALAGPHRVCVLAAPPAEMPAGAEFAPINARPPNVNDISPANLMRFELRQLPLAWQLHRRQRFDVIHRVTPSGIRNATLLSALRAPLVVGPLLAADAPPDSFAPYLDRPRQRPARSRWHPSRWADGLMRRAMGVAVRGQLHLRGAVRILVGTQIAAAHVPPPYRHRCEPITYAGVEHDLFVPPATRPTDGLVRLLSVGRLEPYKGPELLLRSVAIASRKVALRLRVVGGGDPEYAGFLRDLTRELELTHCVEFVAGAPRGELPAMYQQADIFCFPSLCDTYGVALLEAMSCQCAVVVSDVAGPQEIVADGCGLRVPTRRPEQFIEEFAEAIVGLATSPQLRNELGRHARQRILAQHDWSAIARRLLEVYQGL